MKPPGAPDVERLGDAITSHRCGCVIRATAVSIDGELHGQGQALLCSTHGGGVATFPVATVWVRTTQTQFRLLHGDAVFWLLAGLIVGLLLGGAR